MLLDEIKSFIKFFYYTINLSPIYYSKITQKTILLVRLDSIGDYILFRNFLEIFKNHNKYKDYSITLVGNIIWKDLAEYLDSEFINNFIWVDLRKFTRNIFYRYRKIKEINKITYEILIHPTYSRTLETDFVVKLANAIEKIGSIGDTSNIKNWQKKITDNWYTKLLSAKKNIIFEFFRNKEFFENLLQKKINLQKPYIPENKIKKTINFSLPKKYAILFIGASAPFRKWRIENYVKLGNFLKKKYGYDIVVCGGRAEEKDAYRFRELANYNYIDLVGKVFLIDMIYITYKSSLIISNETFLPHLAVALNKEYIFVLSNGNHFGRFVPYPKSVWPYYYPIFHPEIERNLNNPNYLIEKYGKGSNLNINDISIDMVIEKISKIL